MTDERDERLFEEARRLATEMSPERDLWPEIESSITKPARPPMRRQWTGAFAQAAAVVLLIGASSGLTYFAVRDSAVAPPGYAPELVFEQASFGSGTGLGPDARDARSNLVSQLDRELAKLPPSSRDEVHRNLQVIRDAINEINTALEQDPNNALLQNLLLDTYHQELNVMRQVGRLTNNVTSRDDI